MKISIKIVMVVCALFSLPMPVVAGSGWTEHAPVAELIPTIHGRFLVKLKVNDNSSGCREKETFNLGYGIAGSEQIFQTLLEAVASAKMVRVFVTGKCEISGYSEISSVGILP